MKSRKINFFPTWVKVAGSVLILILFSLGNFFYSTYKYQQVINEGSRISDIHCLEVNPLIIDRKNSYVISMDHLLKESIEQYNLESQRYLDISTEYVREEKKWINMQTKFLRDPDVRKYTPKIILQGEQLLIDQRDAEMKSTLSIMKMFATRDEAELEKLGKDVEKYGNLAIEKEEEYWNLVDQEAESYDPREWFITFPQSTCPEENLQIPDTMQDLEDLINPPIEEYSPIT